MCVVGLGDLPNKRASLHSDWDTNWPSSRKLQMSNLEIFFSWNLFSGTTEFLQKNLLSYSSNRGGSYRFPPVSYWRLLKLHLTPAFCINRDLCVLSHLRVFPHQSTYLSPEAISVCWEPSTHPHIPPFKKLLNLFIDYFLSYFLCPTGYFSGRKR